MLLIIKMIQPDIKLLSGDTDEMLDDFKDLGGLLTTKS